MAKKIDVIIEEEQIFINDKKNKNKSFIHLLKIAALFLTITTLVQLVLFDYKNLKLFHYIVIGSFPFYLAFVVYIFRISTRHEYKIDNIKDIRKSTRNDGKTVILEMKNGMVRHVDDLTERQYLALRKAIRADKVKIKM